MTEKPLKGSTVMGLGALQQDQAELIFSLDFRYQLRPDLAQ